MQKMTSLLEERDRKHKHEIQHFENCKLDLGIEQKRERDRAQNLQKTRPYVMAAEMLGRTGFGANLSKVSPTNQTSRMGRSWLESSVESTQRSIRRRA